VLGRGEYLKLNSECIGLVEQRERLLEIALGLAREADDDIGGDGILPLCALDPLDAAHVFVARVHAVHGGQNLRRNRTARASGRDRRARVRVHGVHDGFDEIARCEVVYRTRRMPGIWLTRASSVRIPRGRRRVAETVDVLAEELDVGIACSARRRASAITLSPVRLRSGPRVNGTTQYAQFFVAAFDDGDVGAVRVVAARERRVERLIGIEAQPGDAAGAGFELHQHLA